MTPEGRILAAVVRELEKQRRAGVPLWWLKTHGSAMQRAGVPDLLICLRGKMLGVEVKKPGENATELQAEIMRKMGAAGAACAVVHSVDELRWFLEQQGASDGQERSKLHSDSSSG